MSETNPWIEAARRRATPTQNDAEETTGSADVRDAPIGEGPAPAHQPSPITGAEAPQGGVTPLAPGQGGLPLRMTRPTASLWVVGAHGGAGERSVAALLPEWEAAGHAWPTPADLSQRCPAVLVARTNASGLQAAQLALTQWASGVLGPATVLLGLVLVADAPGRIPKPLRELGAHVSGGAPRTWHVGWVDEWRLGEPLVDDALPKQLRHLIADLTVLSGSPETE